MAVTISLYNHTPKLILAGNIDFSTANNLRVELLNNSASFVATDTTKRQVDNGAANATITVTIATPGVVTDTGSSFSAGQPVKFKTTGALPTGLTANTWYFVLASGLTANSYQLGLTAGGAAINTTGSQSGVHTRYASGSYEVYGNGWAVGGPGIPNVTRTQAAITDATSNDAMFDGDDVSVTAAGGLIGPAYKALVYAHDLEYPIAFVDFGGVQSAGDTTDFKVRWNTNGIIDLTM